MNAKTYEYLEYGQYVKGRASHVLYEAFKSLMDQYLYVRNVVRRLESKDNPSIDETANTIQSITNVLSSLNKAYDRFIMLLHIEYITIENHEFLSGLNENAYKMYSRVFEVLDQLSSNVTLELQ